MMTASVTVHLCKESAYGLNYIVQIDENAADT